jgi:hypothetical protein
MDGGSNQWPAIDGTSNHEWDRPKPLTGPPTSGSQNVVYSAIGSYIRAAILTMTTQAPARPSAPTATGTPAIHCVLGDVDGSPEQRFYGVPLTFRRHCPPQQRQPLLGTPVNVRLRVSLLFSIDTFVALISNIFISRLSLLLRMPLAFYFLIVVCFVMYSYFIHSFVLLCPLLDVDRHFFLLHIFLFFPSYFIHSLSCFPDRTKDGIFPPVIPLSFFSFLSIALFHAQYYSCLQLILMLILFSIAV